jgi:hypothetical protein
MRELNWMTRFGVWSLFLGVASVFAGWLSPALAQTGTAAFDGTWTVDQVCADMPSAKGYSLNFPMEVRNGVVSGQRGPKGAPDSSTLTGQIAADGTATLQLDGLTGPSAYNIGGTAAGSPYSFGVAGTFRGDSGSGRRIQGRSCTFAFTKVGGTSRAASTTLCGERVDYGLIVSDGDGRAKQLTGLWEGTLQAVNVHNLEYTRCFALVVEHVAADGTVRAKYVFGRTSKYISTGNVFMQNAGTGSLRGTVTGDGLSLGDMLQNLRLASANKLEGRYIDHQRRAGAVWLTRR